MRNETREPRLGGMMNGEPILEGMYALRRGGTPDMGNRMGRAGKNKRDPPRINIGGVHLSAGLQIKGRTGKIEPRGGPEYAAKKEARKEPLTPELHDPSAGRCLPRAFGRILSGKKKEERIAETVRSAT